MAGERAADLGRATGWWVEGDFPARAGSAVEPLIDGRGAMLAMCRAFLGARQFILLAGWDLDAELPLVRGGDVAIAGEPGADDGHLTASLRREGLDDAAIELWASGRLRVLDVLGFAASRGVRVGVLLWDAFHSASHVTNDPVRQRDLLRGVGVDCLLDDSSRRITHIAQSLHQKCAVVDGKVAFLGGIDLTVQSGGDYDRWDTHQHPCASPERASHLSAAAHPWHDVHARLRGPIVADVQANIVQRWSEVAARHAGPVWPVELSPEPLPAVQGGGITAQVVRTIPPHTYAFAPQGIATVKDMYLRALGAARRFAYLENQYLWPEVFVGLDALRWGERSPDSMEVLAAIGDALARGVHVGLTLPDHPNCGRRFTDGGVHILRDLAGKAGALDRLHLFTLGNDGDDETLPDGRLYRPVYTHAKTAIVDDTWWTVGSANLNSRGMRSDAELNVSTLDATGARALRLSLWIEHLGRRPDQHGDLLDAIPAFELLDQIARENLDRLRRREPLAGHLLPYLTEDDGNRLGLSVHHEHGLLDNLSGGAGAMPDHHAGKYL